MQSLWKEGVQMPRFKRLEKDLNTDVLIIGGGIAGLLCAHVLQEAGVDYVLLEAERIAGGVTSGTTAKITAQHGLCYQKIASRFGKEGARLYYEINRSALNAYQSVCDGIDCDFRISDSYVYSQTGRKRLETEQRLLADFGVQTEITDQIEPPIRINGALKLANQAQFHPLKFLSAIAKELCIYEDSRVTEMVGTDALIEHARVRAKRVVVATHFPFLNKHGSYFLKLYQSRSYVLAIDTDRDWSGNYIDENDKGLSFRTAENCLLIGCGSHRTGKESEGWSDALRFATRNFPNSKERFRWATQDCMTLDGLPYVGRYSAQTEELYVASGFGKWGMTGAMAASMILCEMLTTGKETPASRLLSPTRSILRPQLAINAMESIGNLILPRKPRCPHLGCALRWNPWERSWDCPCHGSRFSRHGKLLDGPATGNLESLQDQEKK